MKRSIVRRVRESEIERKVVSYAMQRGCLSIKLTPFGMNGWPDRLFVAPNGQHFYIEFKAKYGRLTALQKHMLGKLSAQHAAVHVIDDIAAGRGIVDFYVDVITVLRPAPNEE